VIILAPHLEVKIEADVEEHFSMTTPGPRWVKVSDTEHKTGDTDSDNARQAHRLLARYPEKYREVADKKGEPCPIPVKSANIRYGSLLFEPKEKG